jgi:hypothetical protein
MLARPARPQSNGRPVGTLLILVGRVHLCQLRRAVTKLPVTKSGGRPPIGEKAMTGAERMRRKPCAEHEALEGLSTCTKMSDVRTATRC